MNYIQQLAVNAQKAQQELLKKGTQQKNEMIMTAAQLLVENASEIISQNNEDIINARINGLSEAMIDRLTLNEQRIKALAASAGKVAALNDPIGSVISGTVRPNGLEILKKRVPIGVIGIIYESRPNVTVDSALLCLKASNAVILRGGKEAINTNKTLVNIIKQALEKNKMDPNTVQLVEKTDRETAIDMMKANGYIDLLIPRGGAGLINSVVSNATVPVIQTGAGNCHIYVDKTADLSKAVNIVFNAKTQRVSVCNACENLLVHKYAAEKFLPMVKQKLDTKNVTVYGCDRTQDILKNSGFSQNLFKADTQSYATEFLDYAIAVKVVDDIDLAIEHINQYSTRHSEAIITQDISAAKKFTDLVNSAVVYVNASTRFTDGEEFGMGAEIGISTQMLHARGPMGLEELTTTKYVVNGNGQIRE